MADLVAAILWKRLDVEGHDACRLLRLGHGWQLNGHAIFEHEGRPCSLRYMAECDDAWQARLANVEGWLDAAELKFEIRKTGDAKWSLNGVEQPQAEGCIDVDLGFTPATNLIAIRRFNLGIGQKTPAPAAYLSFPELKLDLLEQNYHRTGKHSYAYQGPVFGYDEVLDVSEVGFVTDYPNLWSGKLFMDA